MASEEPRVSRRLSTGVDADVDLYALVDGGAYLFFHLKDERLAKDDAYARTVAESVPGGRVVGLGRALKVDKRSEPLAPIWFSAPPEDGALWAVEGPLRHRLETSAVLNPGLFLDQRDNRAALAERCREATTQGDVSVLNLFSFTGSFSLAARSGGATQTTSIDVSSRYLAWEKKSFEANFPGAAPAKLIRGDARDFLRRAKGRNEKWHFIVLDPPTFSRADRKVFRVQEHLSPMVGDAIQCLDARPGSAVLVSTNDAGWEPRAFFGAFEDLALREGLSLQRGKTPADFPADHALKSVWLTRG